MTWMTLTLRVVTPLFSGEDPSGSTDSPIRVPSIRGALRYWFRAVAAGHGVTDLAELWAAEQQVFGSTNHPSPIALRIDGQPRVEKTKKPDWAGGSKDKPHGAHYLLGQGLWDRKTGLTRSFVPPTATFDLRIRLSGDTVLDSRFLLALWAWLTYGGLGARTRRGFGQLACVEANHADPILADLTTTRTRQRWEALGTAAIPGQLRPPHRLGTWTWTDADPAADIDLPEFPALTPTWWRGIVLPGGASLSTALDQLGQRWHSFRQATPERSPEWTYAIHGARDRRYPIAALGLPVGYFSPPKRSNFKATVEPHRGSEILRRASPVWLRPIPVGTTWQVFTHVFYARLLPPDAALRVTQDGRGRVLDVPDRDMVESAWDAWLDEDDRLPDNYYGKP